MRCNLAIALPPSSDYGATSRLQSTRPAGRVAELGSLAATSYAMRLFGIALLLVGFLWIGYDTAIGFVDDQHTIWISQSQHMPPGDTLTRSQASGVMRELSLALKDRHRVLLLPALLMLAGGFIAAFSQKRQRDEKAVA